MPLILILLVFYFILIRPMQKKQKQHQVFLKNLKKGDRVITSGGLYGVVQSVDDQTVSLKLSEQVKVKVALSAISGLQPDQGGENG
ncbi:MAG TPA: preprotein translocase subunit YajC [Thermoanaerobaculia bacterium]|nr:preprotein translocase subunit YajC [Thermoanaerobaculia bacterium]HUM30477.1 preprotein translocase subunit YajC [Thermoanaerobaculia bacterium]HXK68656.1 preprotein translocase subunit YajC [Thermoanaerobaculia bacterium]